MSVKGKVTIYTNVTVEEIYKYIEVNPFRGREPVFWGTKIRVSHVLNDLDEGLSIDQILAEHPTLTVGHLEAAAALAANFPTEEERLVFIATGFLSRLG